MCVGLSTVARDGIMDAAALTGDLAARHVHDLLLRMIHHAMPAWTRWDTTARATSAPLALYASTQSLSTMPAARHRPR